MATKTGTKRNTQMKKSDSTAVYKVMAALALLCIGLVYLRKVHKAFSTVGGMELIEPMLPMVAGIGFGLCAICIALFIFLKKPVCQALAPWGIFLFAMVGISAVTMKVEYTFGFPMIYFLWATALVQCIIYQLYGWEFFLFSLPTAAAGFLFYQFRNGFTFSTKNIIFLLVTAVIVIAVIWIANNASKNNGQLVVKGKSVRLFSKRYSPFLHYLVAALWGVCIPVALLLGSLFSFYCMFAAIAIEFIAAVYYTFQLN